MSVAFPALVLFMYVLPGIVFRRSASTAGQFRRQRSVADEFAQGVVIACIGHAIWIWISDRYGKPVDLKSAIMSVIGQYGKDSTDDLNHSISAITDNVWWVLGYFVSLNGFAMATGRFIRWAQLRNWKPFQAAGWFDDEPAAERFREWSGILVTSSKNQALVPLLATVVELGKTAYLFVGILDDIHWAEGGSPDRFVLVAAIRRQLEDDEDHDTAVEQPDAAVDAAPNQLAPDDRWYAILGDKLIIRASEAKTLNILIRKIEEDLLA
jgi:hypothetical protein